MSNNEEEVKDIYYSDYLKDLQRLASEYSSDAHDKKSTKDDWISFSGSYPPVASQSPRPIDNSIEHERESLKNQNYAQNILLKKNTLTALFIFLAIETLVIFVFSFLQASRYWEFTDKFYFEEWSFRVLVSATIIQITIMLQVAVKHLFPEKSEPIQ